MKALDVENRLILFQICLDFLDSNVEIEHWKIGKLNIIKKKETLQIKIIGEVQIRSMSFQN